MKNTFLDKGSQSEPNKKPFGTSRNIRVKLISAFLLIVLIPMLIVTIYSTISMMERSKQEIISRIKSNGVGAAAILNSEVKKYEIMCMNLVNDNVVRMTMQYGVPSQLYEYGGKLAKKHTDIDELAICFADGTKIFSKTGEFDNIIKKVLTTKKPENGIIYSNGLKIISANLIMGTDSQNDDGILGVILISHKLNDDKRLFKDIGVKLNTYAMLYENNSLVTMVDPNGDDITIVDEDKKINTKNYMAYESYVSENKVSIANENYFIYYKTIKDLNGNPVGTIAVAENDGELKKKVIITIAGMGLIFLFFVVLAVWAAIIASNRFTRPIFSLANLMKKVESGVLNIRSDFNSNDEIGMLHHSFNNMVDELAASEDRLDRAQSIAHVGNWELDINSKTIWGTKETFRLLGIQVSLPYITLDSLLNLVHIEDRKIVNELISSLTSNEMSLEEEFRIVRGDGKERFIYVIAVVVNRNEKNGCNKILGVFQDITEKKHSEIELKKSHEELTALYEQLTASEEELQAQFDELQIQKSALEVSQEKYRILVDNISDFIYSYDTDCLFTAANKSFCSSMGLYSDDVIGKSHADIGFPHEYIEQWKQLHEKVISERNTVNGEITIKFADDTTFFYDVTLCPLFNARKQITGITVACHDISEIKNTEKKIRYLAYYDSLTSLPNRVLFTNRLNAAMAKADANGSKCAVMFLDMDNFKKINDTMGHTTGDELLKKVADTLGMCIKGRGTASRFGGDEFLLLLNEVESLSYIQDFVLRLLKIFENPWSIKNNEFYVTMSIGVAIYPDDGTNYEDLLKNVDTAMYTAKSLGKNNYQFYNPSMNEMALQKLNIEKGLRSALKNNEFTVYFQPQVDVKTSRLRGFETLIRWKSPEMGMVSPANFIPVAEDVGLVIPIGDWVLKMSCMQNKKWQDEGYEPVIICVNVSARQLKQPDFVEKVKNTLQETQLDPKYLEIEITESMLMESFDIAIKALDELRALGINIALDDFGTGYSSLNYLKQLPINTLKIDKAFVNDLNRNSVERNIIDLIISLVHKMNIEVVAEGVENREQLQYLVKCGCDIIQGHLLSRALPASDVTHMVKNNVINLDEL
ncbi:MAG: EAL domain-containing protein [Clostridia bacterium]|nr:EAL domain-containing protein [Clostridia bacterium]